ncbi:hypothetical protein [Streptomyces sp. NPDC001422]|uniref:hypothetical protein n=1 Tax=Streptomyces sp. NPDC001422 TaxID=3364575 RepID=UPI0036BBDA2F
MDETSEWGTTEYLLARISDALEVSNYLFIKANSENSDDVTAPDPIPRPGMPEPEPAPARPSASTNEVIDFFTRMNNL